MFVTPAMAQTAAAAAPGGAAAFAQFLLPFVLIFAIMYFLMIRPQQKKMRELKAMVDALRRGDQVVTQGGVIGKVHKVGEDNTLELEVSEGVRLKVLKSAVTQVLSRTEPAKAA